LPHESCYDTEKAVCVDFRKEGLTIGYKNYG